MHSWWRISSRWRIACVAMWSETCSKVCCTTFETSCAPAWGNNVCFSSVGLNLVCCSVSSNTCIALERFGIVQLGDVYLYQGWTSIHEWVMCRLNLLVRVDSSHASSTDDSPCFGYVTYIRSDSVTVVEQNPFWKTCTCIYPLSDDFSMLPNKTRNQVDAVLPEQFRFINHHETYVQCHEWTCLVNEFQGSPTQG